MVITINNILEDIKTDKEIITIADLLVQKSYSYKMLIVRVNDVFISKEKYSTTTIKNGDNVQVIHLMTGG